MLTGNPSSSKITYQDICRSAAGVFMPHCRVTCSRSACKEHFHSKGISRNYEHVSARCRLVALPGDSIAAPLEDFMEQDVASQLDAAVHLPACTLETGGQNTC